MSEVAPPIDPHREVVGGTEGTGTMPSQAGHLEKRGSKLAVILATMAGAWAVYFAFNQIRYYNDFLRYNPYSYPGSYYGPDISNAYLLILVGAVLVALGIMTFLLPKYHVHFGIIILVVAFAPIALPYSEQFVATILSIGAGVAALIWEPGRVRIVEMRF